MVGWVSLGEQKMTRPPRAYYLLIFLQLLLTFGLGVFGSKVAELVNMPQSLIFFCTAAIIICSFFVAIKFFNYQPSEEIISNKQSKKTVNLKKMDGSKPREAITDAKGLWTSCIIGAVIGMLFEAIIMHFVRDELIAVILGGIIFSFCIAIIYVAWQGESFLSVFSIAFKGIIFFVGAPLPAIPIFVWFGKPLIPFCGMIMGLIYGSGAIALFEKEKPSAMYWIKREQAKINSKYTEWNWTAFMGIVGLVSAVAGVILSNFSDQAFDTVAFGVITGSIYGAVSGSIFHLTRSA